VTSSISPGKEVGDQRLEAEARGRGGKAVISDNGSAGRD